MTDLAAQPPAVETWRGPCAFTVLKRAAGPVLVLSGPSGRDTLLLTNAQARQLIDDLNEAMKG